jgi:hypothetical protein
MDAPRQSPIPNIPLYRAQQSLQDAESDLLEAIRLGSHPNNAVLLEAHALLREVISALSKAVSPTNRK